MWQVHAVDRIQSHLRAKHNVPWKHMYWHCRPASGAPGSLSARHQIGMEDPRQAEPFGLLLIRLQPQLQLEDAARKMSVRGTSSGSGAGLRRDLRVSMVEIVNPHSRRPYPVKRLLRHSRAGARVHHDDRYPQHLELALSRIVPGFEAHRLLRVVEPNQSGCSSEDLESTLAVPDVRHSKVRERHRASRPARLQSPTSCPHVDPKDQQANRAMTEGTQR